MNNTMFSLISSLPNAGEQTRIVIYVVAVVLLVLGVCILFWRFKKKE